jgi:hypothetical protein
MAPIPYLIRILPDPTSILLVHPYRILYLARLRSILHSARY